jgi:hypothetical protein
MYLCKNFRKNALINYKMRIIIAKKIIKIQIIQLKIKIIMQLVLLITIILV